jgi:sugar transferase (PEP-CTERM/EpsH1 system associated)
MRILFITPYVPSLIRVRPFNLIKQLSRLGHKVTVLTLESSEQEQEQIELLRTYCHQVRNIHLTKLRSVWNCLRALPTLTPLQAAYCFSPAMDSLIQQTLSTGRFGIVHVEHLRAAHFGKVVRNVPKVYDAVDSISLLQERTLQHGLFINRLLAHEELLKTRRYEAQIINTYDHVLITSEVDRQAFLSLRPSVKISLLRNGVDLDYFSQDGSLEESNTLIFTGKMSYHANAGAISHFVRHVFPLVRAKTPTVRLQIVGSNPPERVRKLAKDEGIDVTGFVPDLRPYFRKAAVCVCPMLVKVGVSNKILEAMAMKVPVVSPRLGCEGLDVIPKENILLGDNPADFAAQVIRLLEDKGLRRKIAMAGRAYVERNHDWRAVGKQLQRIYQEVLEERSHGRENTPS